MSKSSKKEPTVLEIADAAALIIKRAALADTVLRDKTAVAAEMVLKTAKDESSSQIFVIGQQIAKLEGVVLTETGKINKHLEELNHQVVDHSKIINKILANDGESKAEKKGMVAVWKVMVTVGTLVVGALGAIATYFHTFRPK